jgi:hypothetical protein
MIFRKIWPARQIRTAVHDREGDDLTEHGLYLDLPPWGYHVFAVQPAQKNNLLHL